MGFLQTPHEDRFCGCLASWRHTGGSLASYHTAKQQQGCNSTPGSPTPEFLFTTTILLSPPVGVGWGGGVLTGCGIGFGHTRREKSHLSCKKKNWQTPEGLLRSVEMAPAGCAAQGTCRPCDHQPGHLTNRKGRHP